MKIESRVVAILHSDELGARSPRNDHRPGAVGDVVADAGGVFGVRRGLGRNGSVGANLDFAVLRQGLRPGRRGQQDGDNSKQICGFHRDFSHEVDARERVASCVGNKTSNEADGVSTGFPGQKGTHRCRGSELASPTSLPSIFNEKKPGTGNPLHTPELVTVASFRTWRGWRECVAWDRYLTLSSLPFELGTIVPFPSRPGSRTMGKFHGIESATIRDYAAGRNRALLPGIALSARADGLRHAGQHGNVGCAHGCAGGRRARRTRLSAE